MCGIAGILGPDDGLDAAALLAALRHRGPDRQAAARPAPGVWLGATRLAINDLSSAGDQPMTTADGALTVVHNGEIYNAPALREALAAHGHVFRSRCDTEVLLHGYRQWGDDVVLHLEGMFAFALWDGPRRRTLLARDPIGIKPLWLVRRGPTLIFASEVRALVAARAANVSLAGAAVGTFLATGSVAEPQAIVRGVVALAAGHRLIAANDVVRAPDRYWAPPDRDCSPATSDASHSVRARLEAAIVGCLEADVPVGLLLSGGMDSAALGLLARSHGQVETFHVRIGAAGADRAHTLARALGTQHHEIHVDAVEAECAATASLAAQDQPSVDGLNTFLVAGAIRRAGLKAAVTGLGADEIFLGYSLHRNYLRARALQAQLNGAAAPLRQTAAAAARLPWRGWRLPKLLDLVAADGAQDTYAAARALFPRAALRRLLPDAQVPSPLLDVSGTAAEVTRLELSNYLLNTLLRDADVMSMAHGVELRVPMLDRRLVEEVMPLPMSMKLRRGTNKPLLAAAVPELPSSVTRARKEGFDLPLEQWLLGPLRPTVESALRSPSDAARVGLERRAVTCVWERFLHRRDRPSAYRAWALHALINWARAHGASA